MSIRRISISILAVAALGLAACGGQSSVDPGDALTPTVQETTAAAEPQETAVDETPVAEDTPAAEPTATEPTSPADASDREDPAEIVILSAIAQAIEAAENHSGGTAYKIDDEDGDNVWEIDVLLPDGGGMEIDVDRANYSIVDTDTDDPDVRELPSTTLLEAISAAMAHTPGVLDDAELDTEDGRVVWQVELDKTADGDDIELYLDAETLDVVKIDD